MDSLDLTKILRGLVKYNNSPIDTVTYYYNNSPIDTVTYYFYIAFSKQFLVPQIEYPLGGSNKNVVMFTSCW